MENRKSKYPQVLLLGNGLNRAYGGDSGDKLIERIWIDKEFNKEFKKDLCKDIPFPLRVVLATGDTVDKSITKNINLFYGVDDITEITAPIRKLLDIGFDQIITTNYSYELERVANPKVERDGKYCKNLLKHTEGSKNAETQYRVYTYNAVNYGGKTHNIWHIHGEARVSDSIVLGHYWYGKILNKFQEELCRRRNQQYDREKKGLPMIMRSWLDAFIMGDVYCLGFGYDFSEIDMWWLLNRKKRENASHGKFYYYAPEEEKEEKEGEKRKIALLKAYDAIVENFGHQKDDGYKSFYEKAIEDIREQVNSKRGEQNHV